MANIVGCVDIFTLLPSHNQSKNVELKLLFSINISGKFASNDDWFRIIEKG